MLQPRMFLIGTLSFLIPLLSFASQGPECAEAVGGISKTQAPIPAAALISERHIIYNDQKLKKKGVKDFALAGHECAHLKFGENERTADYEGGKMMKQKGLWNKSAEQEITSFLINAKSSNGKHAPGPERIKLIKQGAEGG